MAALIWVAWLLTGEVHFGRLERIPEPALAPHNLVPVLALLGLTAAGLPASTTFLAVGPFAGAELERMLTGTALGYVIGAGLGYAAWSLIPARRSQPSRWWQAAQWAASMGLWVAWLQHDVCNITIFMARRPGALELAAVTAVMAVVLAAVFRLRGGLIQRIVQAKHSSDCLREATLIAAGYALALWLLKGMTAVPVSTTWCFLGWLTGRELALRGRRGGWPLAVDAGKATVGVMVSVAVVGAVP
jgi:hypothetical protein